MSVPTDAVFEIPEDGDNEGARPQEGGEHEAYVDESNVPHPHREAADDPSV
ncbi:hypothetical protein GGG17_00530 [Arsenicicoccus sp. MKL-02]|uniref:Uncharacterized protein n=1 Tax=Arsenicicoccus cauae TaxID=2663847 RepID=A0A6I3IPE3_9MICO|nr:hypothetical protein [Arsenicicoccus cauae]MTB70489.1 hypothetical protein [Arsenicicoccus cauae]